MFFPIKTDRRLLHVPWLNFGLIAVNLAAFLASQQGLSRAAAPYWLYSFEPRLEQFITYQFLHANWGHLLSNMVFLYVFGNSVEDRLGKLGYLFFYLAGGVLAGLGHILSSDNPVLGASGSVAAVCGAYLALFPKTHVTILYWVVFFVGAFEVSSLVLILFNIGMNVVFHVLGVGNVAYLAHLCGYAYGFLIGMGLLWLHLLPRESHDLLAMWERHRRRAEFHRMTRSGYQPWEAPAAPPPPGRAVVPPPLSADRQRLVELRQAVAGALSQHNLGQAAEFYSRLIEMDGSQVMAQDQQLDLANQLMSQGRHELAARAYELFLNHFRHYEQREQVELILALAYLRYLDRRQRARELLLSALPRLRDHHQKALAQKMLLEIG